MESLENILENLILEGNQSFISDLFTGKYETTTSCEHCRDDYKNISLFNVLRLQPSKNLKESLSEWKREILPIGLECDTCFGPKTK